MGLVDYNKFFDSVETPEVIDALREQEIEPAFVNVLQHICKYAKSYIRLRKDSKRFRLQRGVQQGDTGSPKLFIACLENVFRKLRSEIEEQQAVVDEEIAQLTKRLNELILGSTLEAKKCEEELVEQARGKQLDFEKAQLKLKLDYERKTEEARKSHASGSSSSAKTEKLPKLVITKFGEALTNWPRFWNQFEAEIDRSYVPGVTKFSYL